MERYEKIFKEAKKYKKGDSIKYKHELFPSKILTGEFLGYGGYGSTILYNIIPKPEDLKHMTSKDKSDGKIEIHSRFIVG